MLLAGIPPLEIVPTYGFQITNDYKMEDKKDQAVALLKTLSTQFNTEISAVADTLNADMAATAKFFDMSAFVSRRSASSNMADRSSSSPSLKVL